MSTSPGVLVVNSAPLAVNLAARPIRRSNSPSSLFFTQHCSLSLCGDWHGFLGVSKLWIISCVLLLSLSLLLSWARCYWW